MLSSARSVTILLLFSALLGVFSNSISAQVLRKKGIVSFLILQEIKTLKKAKKNSFVKEKNNLVFETTLPISTSYPLAFIPKFERPKGAVFCRMEDAIEQRTKLFKLTVGVK